MGRRVGVRYAELVIEPEPQHLDIEGRPVSGTRWKDAGDSSEVVVEIFDPRGPIRRNGKFGADTERPAGTGEQDMVLSAGDAGRFAKARLRPGKAAGSVDEPMIECVAD